MLIEVFNHQLFLELELRFSNQGPNLLEFYPHIREELLWLGLADKDYKQLKMILKFWQAVQQGLIELANILLELVEDKIQKQFSFHKNPNILHHLSLFLDHIHNPLFLDK